MTRRSRRARVRSVAEARDAAGATAVARGLATYWLTRDTPAGGSPAPVARVWLRRPARYSTAWGTWWHAEREDGTPALYGEWTPQAVARNGGTWPDDGRQCVRREGCGVVPVGMTGRPEDA